MHIQFIKGQPDQMVFTRADGSREQLELPPGCVYHDLSHFTVESALGIKTGYFGMIQQGFLPSDYTLEDSERPFSIDADGYKAEFLATMVQTEAMIGHLSPEFVSTLEKSCVETGIPFPEKPEDAVWEELVQETRELIDQWNGLQKGAILDLGRFHSFV